MNDTQHNTIISIRGEETKRKENNLLYKVVATPLGHLATLTGQAPKAPFPNNMGYYYRVS
jgi:hypothetical protein